MFAAWHDGCRCCAALGGGAAVVSEDQLQDKEKARTGQGMSADEVAHEPGAALREAESERQGRGSKPGGPPGQGNYSDANGATGREDFGGADGNAGRIDGDPEQASSACGPMFGVAWRRCSVLTDNSRAARPEWSCCCWGCHILISVAVSVGHKAASDPAWWPAGGGATRRPSRRRPAA